MGKGGDSSAIISAHEVRLHVIIRFRAQGNRGTLAQTALFPSIHAGLREQFVPHVTFRPPSVPALTCRTHVAHLFGRDLDVDM